THHVAQPRASGGWFAAADVHAGRVRTGTRTAARVGVAGVIAPLVADGAQLPLRDASFDRVLLDAPCSGLGVLRRRPDARWRVEPESVQELATLQRVLLAAAARPVHPAGPAPDPLSPSS